MTATTRQTTLLVAEDWTKLYQTFRDANFQAYDFQTLRKSMVDYLRLYYPEDFNDFIESSEFIALLEKDNLLWNAPLLIAGQWFALNKTLLQSKWKNC